MFESLQVWFGAFCSFPFVHLSLYIYQNVLATSTLQAWYSRTTRLAQIPQLVLPVLGFCSYHMNILTSALAVGFKSPVRLLPWVNCDLWISMGEGGDNIFTRLNTPSMNMVYYGPLVFHVHHYLALLRKVLNASLGFCFPGTVESWFMNVKTSDRLFKLDWYWTMRFLFYFKSWIKKIWMLITVCTSILFGFLHREPSHLSTR